LSEAHQTEYVPVQSNFFLDCERHLAHSAQTRLQDQQVTNFLSTLNYLPEENQSPASIQNRCALLGLASQLKDIFHLPTRYPSKASFFGAIIEPETFGFFGFGKTSVGVGGRGFTVQQAFESCVGEAAEYLSFLQRPNDPLVILRNGDDGLQPQERDWVQAVLGPGQPDAPGMDAQIQASSLIDGRTVWFPGGLVLRQPGNARWAQRSAESNGVGAGRDYNHAVFSGMTEVIERDAFALWWFGEKPAYALNPEIENNSEFKELILDCRGASNRQIWFLDISTEIAIPVVAAFSSMPDGSAVVAGFAADPDPLIAAKKAFLEVCQMEIAQEISIAKHEYYGEKRLSAQDRIWLNRHKNLSVGKYPLLTECKPATRPLSPTWSDTHNMVIEMLDQSGFTPFVINLSRPDINIPVVRVLVPGLQSAKADWISPRLKSFASKTGVDHCSFENKLSPI